MRPRLPEDQINHAVARHKAEPQFLDELEEFVDRTRRALGGVHEPRRTQQRPKYQEGTGQRATETRACNRVRAALHLKQKTARRQSMSGRNGDPQ